MSELVVGGGNGRCAARAPKLARVGVVESSIRDRGSESMSGAVLGRGVVGVVASARWPYGSGARPGLMGSHTDMVGGC